MTTDTTGDEIEQAAQRLTEARLAVDVVDTLELAAPTDLDAAYRTADRHAQLLGWDVIGWKVGCTSERAQEILSCPHPVRWSRL